MKWLRFSLRSLLVLVALAALCSLGLRWYLDRPYARVERAMEAIWRDSPNASIFFDQGTGELYVENAEKVSTKRRRRSSMPSSFESHRLPASRATHRSQSTELRQM